MPQRIALVTGGIGGIGTEICKYLAADGARVVATYIAAEADKAREWREARRQEGHDMAVYEVDVADFASCSATVGQAQSEVGPIDILVNNAGITRDATLRKMTYEQWSSVLRTNLDSAFNMSKQVIDGMMERGFGRIINISSINGQMGQFGQANYSASKAGVHGFTMALARETARKGVTVNTVSPGYIGTEMVMAIAEDIRNRIVAEIPVGRLGRPTEIARVVAFLAAEESSFITGADFSINGGQHMY
jgi:acetoacetyl-CoA reductase